jgi:type II secretion system protein H
VKRHASRGFTLIELIVVLVIMGVVLSAATPAFTVRAGPASDEAVEQIVSVLRSARRTALQTARATTVTIDPVAARIWVRTAGASVMLDTTFVLSLPADAQLTSNTPRVTFTFDARGLASGEELTVTSTRGRSAVTVDPANGDARVATVSATRWIDAR